MKKIFYIFVVSLLVLAGCTKDGRVVSQLAGDWHYTAEENGVQEDIWISFTEDGIFEMYQRVTADVDADGNPAGAYWHSTGEFEYDADSKVLAGIYSDRYPWKYSYRIAITDKTLQMTAVELETYVVTYTRETIPSAVREKSLPLTKSEAVERYL